MPTLDSFRDIAEVNRTQPNVQFQVSLLGSGLIDTQAEIPAVGIQSTIARTDISRADSKIWMRTRELRAWVSHTKSASSYAESARQDLTRDLLPLLRNRIKDAYSNSDQTLVDREELEPLFRMSWKTIPSSTNAIAKIGIVFESSQVTSATTGAKRTLAPTLRLPIPSLGITSALGQTPKTTRAGGATKATALPAGLAIGLPMWSMTKRLRVPHIHRTRTTL